MAGSAAGSETAGFDAAGEQGQAELSELERAVDRLERTVLDTLRGGPVSEGFEAERDRLADELAHERDRLAAEVAVLRENAARDAELRDEAAAAVKAALEDLRALMPEGARHG
ncbi:MAG: hypothetical protein ACFBRM_12340 [Pikeienuella sp.]